MEQLHNEKKIWFSTLKMQMLFNLLANYVVNVGILGLTAEKDVPNLKI